MWLLRLLTGVAQNRCDWHVANSSQVSQGINSFFVTDVQFITYSYSKSLIKPAMDAALELSLFQGFSVESFFFFFFFFLRSSWDPGTRLCHRLRCIWYWHVVIRSIGVGCKMLLLHALDRLFQMLSHPHRGCQCFEYKKSGILLIVSLFCSLRKYRLEKSECLSQVAFF